MMNKKYIMVAFAMVVIALKYLIDLYGIDESYSKVLSTLKTVYLFLFIAAFLHFLSLFLFTLIRGNKKEEWWERTGQEKEIESNKLLTAYIELLPVTVPVLIYCLIAFFAFKSWKYLLVFALAFLVNWIITHLRTKGPHLDKKSAGI